MFIDLTNEKEKLFDERNKLCNFLLTHATMKTDWYSKTHKTQTHSIRNDKNYVEEAS